ncbi:glycoside hydrolase family 2 protein [Gelatoporia subvermispora B]|uniref:Beta-mannosidase B n=1 Tax=Ceriporiopsis subvermispora (strain B) TaxID=914234 RepID=M2RLX2_CERS8|nr:glycoside hydrolase family 2 protein [Gelatoporia subvermispora B]
MSLPSMSSDEVLNASWHWKERDITISRVVDELPGEEESAAFKGWNVAQASPSEVHVELLKIGRIPDPFVGFNEHQVQWIGKKEWLFFCAFTSHYALRSPHVEVVFEGLDTFCDAYLNGDLVLQADNMFRTYKISVDADAIGRPHNVLLLHFKSAKTMAMLLEQRHGRVRAGSSNLGDPSRVYVRKAQYNWRWDWGPELMTCGPYRPIHLISYSARLSDVHIRACVGPGPLYKPALKIGLSVDGDITAAKRVWIALHDAHNQNLVAEKTVDLTNLGLLHNIESTARNLGNVVEWELYGLVELWWPIGFGKQQLYVVYVTLFDEGNNALDKYSKRIGFRDVALVQESLTEPDQYGQGTTFLFQVNGTRMFIGGSNWIPADSFLTRITSERYRAWLTLLKEGNQNMVRIWGGGIYEPDVFYDICDEMGILVWQDFQFACGVYPAYDEFVASVKAEAEDNVRRLRHHPCIALFCGNNEDYQQVLQWGDVADLPARLIYESVLPDVVERLTDPPIPYHRGSPYGGENWNTADPTVGDIHQWDVWAGKERPWQEYPSLGGRFVSEFGIPSMPDIRTVDHWLAGNEKERWAQSKTMAQHCRAGNHERRFAIVMNENFRLTADLETHIYNTQIMQSEAVSLAYRAWRREWRGPGKEYNGGALIWQLNDCWPVTSWSIVDYFLRPKPAYHTIARELASETVGILRTVTQNRENDRSKQFYEFGSFRSVDANVEVWATTRSLQSQRVKLELTFFNLETSSPSQVLVHDVILHSNQSTELLSMRIPCDQSASPGHYGMTNSYSVVIGARLLHTGSGEVLARFVDWPQPYRHVDFPEPRLQIQVDGERITVTCSKPVKGLWFSVVEEGVDDVKWSDNALDVMPGDTQVIYARGLEGRSVKFAHMGKEKATVL